jgi:tetratricopeptide (TPR) repeat protein
MKEDIVTAFHHRLSLLAAAGLIGTAVVAAPNMSAAIPMNDPNPVPSSSAAAAPAAKKPFVAKKRTVAVAKHPTKKRAHHKKKPTAPVAQKTSAADDFLAGYHLAYDLVYSRHDYAGGIARLRALGRDDHSDVATMIGYASRKLGRYDDAKYWYDKALAADPNNARTLSYYGMWHAEQGNTLKATDYLEKVEHACGNTTCQAYAELKAVIGGARIY